MNREYRQTHFFDMLLNPAEAEEMPPPPVPESEPETEPEEEAMLPLAPLAVEDQQQGRLPQEARRALIALMRHGVVMAENKRLLFEALCRYRAGIQEHLADMNLRLLLDEKAGIAMLLTQGGDGDGDEEGASLINRRTLSLYDTLLLLVLRKHYQERETAGEQRVIIDNERIETALRPFLPLTNSSRGDLRQLNGALNTMKDRRILGAVRGEDDRYEITPVIRYVVNAAFLEQMLGEYTRLAERSGSETNDE
ncbi:DUF4194 domain-containing protein [Methylomicrobium agile]|uniref:DUF4194 domain-containing protein n=1 Tax=Methylomicrobium agile TaxID=39774 RepID=UPI0004DF5D8E|nr:DUF4194 domain-containing protein [Methylomicrobium agile]